MGNVSLNEQIKQWLELKKSGVLTEDSFDKMSNNAIASLEKVISFAERNNMTDTQEFLDFEDRVNKLSVQDHNKNKQEFLKKLSKAGS